MSHNASLIKFGENVSNTLQDIVLTYRDAHMDARTYTCTQRRTGQNHYASGHIMLGGGIKMHLSYYAITMPLNTGVAAKVKLTINVLPENIFSPTIP